MSPTMPTCRAARRRLLSTLSILAVLTLSACASLGGRSDFTSYVVLGPDGAAVARVLIDAPSCPLIRIDQRERPMDLRAPPATVAQRPTASTPELSKPSVFPLLTCEALLPAGTASASVLGRSLPLPRAAPTRIIVIGDTGCRLKLKDNAYQACNDAAQYPFATVAAAAAAWHPDLVIHVGDYLYRENPCPPDHPGCSGSPWGYGWDAWNADFFAPGAALLRAAPWVLVRGNHESCTRGGQGYWRWLDPRPLQAGRDCDAPANDDLGNYSPPYAVPLGGQAQLLVLDTASTDRRGLHPGDAGYEHYRDNYRQLEALAARAPYNIGVDHHPLLAFGALRQQDGSVTLYKGDAGLQQAFGSLNPQLLPASMQVLLSGHVHVWQQTSFSSDHPSQFVAGFSGTEEEIVPLPLPLPPGASPAPGAVLEHISSWIDGFGYMALERRGPQRWDVTVYDLRGQVRNTCRIDGRHSECARMQVQ